jgi:hypothetical protein
MAQRVIGFVGFDGMQALDLIGPADAFGSDAFAALTAESGDRGSAAPYRVVVVGLHGKQFTTSCGVVMQAAAAIPQAVPSRYPDSPRW